MRAAFLFTGRMCFMMLSFPRSSPPGPRAGADFRLVPLHVQRHRNYQIRFADERAAILVFFVLRGSHHPNVAVIVPAEFALWIGPVRGRSEQTVGTETPDEFLIVIAVHGAELLHRPGRLNGTEFDIVGGMQLAVAATLV